MTFYIQGLVGHEVMPLVRLFNRNITEKIHKVSADKRVEMSGKHTTTINGKEINQQHTGLAIAAYQDSVEKQGQHVSITAEEIMVTPVVTLKSSDALSIAMAYFKKHAIRHIPVLNSMGDIDGIISDRDLLHFVSGVSGKYEQHQTHLVLHTHINQVMTPEVLTASTDTDIRYIARLFVERRIGAMPIVRNNKLAGIITRSDILSAVMRHFNLEIWV